MHHFFRTLVLLFAFTSFQSAFAQMPAILSLQQQGEVRDRWLQERVATVLPEIMRREGIDMWILISREYNEDPVLKTMLPSFWLSARRTTMLVIYDNGEELETLACARYDVGEVFKKAWDKEQQPDQWQRLAEIIAERQPRKIGVNRSEHFGLADGISSYHYDQLREVLPETYTDRLVSAERLAIGWLESRTPDEMAVYQQIVRIAHQIIAEGFSDAVIQPGVTTTDEVVWWYRERIRELGLVTWFHPTVDIQRADPESFDHLRAFSKRPDQQVIQPGDLLHVDFGITYLGLNTDTQENAYVLRPGETEAPDYIQDAFRKGLRLMDILTGEYKAGRSGNEVLASALKKAKAEGLQPTIYTHPIGFHGHAAGPTIGLWDQQGGVPHKGDYPLFHNTAYSIELNTAVEIPQWKKTIRMMMEEDAYFDETGVRYIDGRQTELFLIPRQSPYLGK
ncbi:M24 family metallopeptidase [Flavilitoribacter nigricans]|uniref:Xaa-Pro aminopeptidase n=1 Tax=Flavilitoribacter nigricans (strain ATCC 23147 / DSM 23189 / NBRC 102662 / NCIMB 1420 / SS-2) TaxID=1122177 RepID=A0A2D0N0J2_FLAN2|nr:M24 family metallopeptidase [Flavilitoribacter nigricans]PHN02034.1 Xaa-Pro aminopeptidase [Flavilitoribacter nigricans DSM 23189 = NBRC 102662]